MSCFSSEEAPDSPLKPLSLFKTNSALEMGRPDHSTVSEQSGVWWKMREASRDPERVPPGSPVKSEFGESAQASVDRSQLHHSPSRGVSPIDVFLLSPPWIKQQLPPLPRCATTTLTSFSGTLSSSLICLRMEA